MKTEVYKIIPIEPSEPSSLAFKKPTTWGAGCFLLISIFAAGVFIDRTKPNATNWGALVGLELFVLLITAAIYYMERENAIREARKSWLRAQRVEAEREALDLSHKANVIEKSFWTNLESLPKALAGAQSAVNAAALDYSERAFGPFWDNIGRAAGGLAAFNASVKEIQVSTGEYRKILKERNHNFPALVIRPEELPDPMPIAERFRQLVRAAQQDPDFSVIWEHRKTREVLIQGFSSLAEAIDGLSWTLEDATANLKNAISESSDKMVREQRQMRESVNGALEKWDASKRLY